VTTAELITDFKRVRVASGRFQGLVVFHLHGETHPDDLTDLALLRLTYGGDQRRRNDWITWCSVRLIFYLHAAN
jgi:hypothetical protein